MVVIITIIFHYYFNFYLYSIIAIIKNLNIRYHFSKYWPTVLEYF